ncbi:MAG: divergent PAP2 family protein [bacterium]
MKTFFEVISSPIFLAPFLAWVIAQAIKTIVYTIRYHKFDFRSLFRTGGMPSSHAGGTVALTVSLGRTEGWVSPLFVMSLVFTFIIMNDAASVRRSSGQQARILNKMITDGKIDVERVKEFLGHSPIEVIVGGILGAIMGVILT